MFAGWGIRTLSSSAVAYHPIGYHLGTVWPHDNSLIGRGFRRYGLDEAAERLFLGLLDAAQDFPNDRLPECFAGFGQEEFGIPVRYPVACHPQAWAAGAIPELLVSTLGLEPDGFAGCLRVRRPLLPEGVEVVEVRDLPVGSGTAHLRFVRRAGETSVEVLETTGDLKVVTGPDADGSSGEDPAP
jgi:glycogen debranching enzyme